MTSCANSHDRDETCPSCDPTRLPPRDRPGPPVARERALDHVHQLQDQLAHVDGFPAVPLDEPDDDEPTEETAPA